MTARARLAAGALGAVACATAAFGAPTIDYDPRLFTYPEAIALYQAELHGILAPHSSRDLRSTVRRTCWNTRRAVTRTHVHQVAWTPAKDLELLPSLYRVEKTADGYQLYVKKLPGMASILLLAPPAVNPATGRWETFALRSATPIPANGTNSLARPGNPGDAQGLHFLLSTSTIKDAALGEAFRVVIPAKTLWGYWQTLMGELAIGKDSSLRVAFYDRPRAAAGAASRVYLVKMPG